eukprot:4581711-Prymnesium_polylepis.1
MSTSHVAACRGGAAACRGNVAEKSRQPTNQPIVSERGHDGARIERSRVRCTFYRADLEIFTPLRRLPISVSACGFTISYGFTISSRAPM